ncbi:MAG: twin-arginine translocase subunit TatC [Bacteroidetes bacterium]|nr:twin-arginine translocase subunit TatC [Bacteroidota bacterium]
MSENTNMSFLSHLEELRWRLVRCAAAVLVVGLAIWFFQGYIMDYLFLSMMKSDFVTFRVFCEVLGVCVEDVPVKMQSTTVSGQFSYAMMLSILGGVVGAFPYIVYQLWKFIEPGLKVNEKSNVKGIVFYISLLFFIGILFGYFIVAPLSVQFFGSFTISNQIENNFTISSYMSMILSTIFYCGLFFLLPVVSYFLTRIGLFGSDFLKKYRRHAIVVILILAAIITPPDVISQVVVTIPIYILYEISILVSVRVEKQIEKDEKNS